MSSDRMVKNGTWVTGKSVFLAIAAIYFLGRAADRNGYGFLDNVNLVFHEAGHVILSGFGDIIGVAGGTAMQLLVPAALVVYFFAKRNRYAASFVLMWLGQSSINAARYAADAVKQELPLLGGGMHDWTYLLSLNNSLGRAQQVSDAFYYAGVAIIMGGIIIGVLSFKGDRNGIAREDE